MKNTELEYDTISVTEYGVFDFCVKVQELFNQGYRFDFDSNERCPSSFGTLVTAVLVKAKDEVNTEDKADVNTEVGTEASVVETEAVVEASAEAEVADTEKSVVATAVKRGRKAAA